jgi:hypothetical protein
LIKPLGVHHTGIGSLLCLAWAVNPVNQVAMNKGPTPLHYTFRRCAKRTMIYIYLKRL